MRNLITDVLLSEGESETVEFKTSSTSLSSVAEVVCGLLNSNGGVVVIGVDDHGTPDGNADQELANNVQEYLLKSVSPVILFDVTLDEVADGSVICIGVPSGLDRPFVFDGSVFVRHGSQTQKADADKLRSLAEAASRDVIRWERRPCVNLEIEQLDEQPIRETVRRSQDRRGYVYENPHDIASVLSKLALLQTGQLTNAADVLFGKQVAQHHPQTRLRAVCYATDKAQNFIDEQVFEGPAYTLLDNAMAFLKRHISIAANFSGENLARESKPQYPFDALREGMVNAIVHRDYASFSGSISVSVYADRVEIWNAGSLPKGVSPRDLTLPSHASVLINPDIGHVFYLYELMERVGRGTYKITRQCTEFGMRRPQWKRVNEGIRLTLFAPTLGVPSSDLNGRQRAFLDATPIGNEIRSSEYIAQFGKGVSQRQARRDLSELETLGLIRRVGSGSKTAYLRVEGRR